MKSALSVVATLSIAMTACGPVKFSTKVVSDPGSTGVSFGSPSPSGTVIPSGSTSPNASVSPTGSVSPGVSVSPAPATRDVHNVIVVKNPDQKVDILLNIDISNSMTEDNLKLASKLAGFVTKLQNTSIDWQMCLTVPYDKNVDSTGAITATGLWGRTWGWVGYTAPSGYKPYVLRAGTSNLSTIINNTIAGLGSGWIGSDDERGLKQTYWHFANGNYNNATNNGCYRSDAALATIMISDEDERSVGGDASAAVLAGENKPLEPDDLPSAVTDQVRNVFGASKRFTFNSIVVKPGDIDCMNQQDAQAGATSKAHYGTKYVEASNLTGGGVGSICEADFSNNLNLFFNQVVTSLSSVTLECAPVGAVNVVPSPFIAVVPGVIGNRLNLSPAVPAGTTLTIDYKCPQ